MEKEYVAVENLKICHDIENLADDIWEEVVKWEYFARDTVGKQLVKAADSIGANIYEGDGRYYYKDSLKFFYIARGSVKETRYWLRRAKKRRLMDDEKAQSFIEQVEALIKQLNSLITARRRWSKMSNHPVT